MKKITQSLLTAITVIVLTLPLVGNGQQSASLFDTLPVEYYGTFRWNHDDIDVQQVSITFENQQIDKDGNYLLLGQGLYETSAGDTAITVRSIVDPQTYAIEIWEGLPENNGKLVIHGQPMEQNEVSADTSDFITEGSHIGVMTSSLRFIEATWTTTQTGEQGVLKLQRQE